MKKVFVTLLMGVALLFSGNLYAGNKIYSVKPVPGKPAPTPNPHIPKSPTNYPLIVVIDEVSGELSLVFYNTINSVDISISENGVIIENDSISVVSGQTVLYDLATYDVGIYTLSIETGGDLIAEYSITIEEE